ncbi:MAG: FtsX-like permease family protein [Acidobacteriota bacterium]
MSAFLPPPLLRRAAVRHLVRRPWLAGLTVAGVALAVAVVVGINLANESAERAFRLSVDDVAGRATHQITGGPTGLEDRIYTELRVSGLPGARDSAPVIEGRVRVTGEALRLLGVDPWAEAPIRPLTAGIFADQDALAVFLSRPSVVLGTALASRLAVTTGDTLLLEPTGQNSGQDALEVRVTALLEAADERQERALADLLLTDIATAQELFSRPGRLDRIDLVATAENLPALEALLPASVLVEPSGSRTGALDEMTRAFRLNLTALSMLALLVGMFLIYNAMTFLVVERRQLLGRWRAMGVERRQILSLVLFEAAVLGALGSALGLVLGQILARGLLQLITQTINDLYFVLQVRDVAPPLTSLVLGVVLGVGGALLAALGPALEASGIQPQSALRRSLAEAKERRKAPKLAVAGLGLGALAALLALVPGKNLALGFASVFLATVAFAAFVPLLTLIGSRFLAAPAGALFGGLGRMAARDVGAALSRTGVAIAALCIAIATTIGVAVMVSSFRSTLVDWLGVTLQADLYVSPVQQDGRGRGPALDPAVIAAMTSHPQVASASTYRRVEVPSSNGPAQLHALHTEREAFRVFSFKNAADRDALYDRFSTGDGVLISEPYAFRHGLTVGESLELRSAEGPRDFEVLAIFYDYASDRGLVMMDAGLYGRLWRDDSVQSLGLFLEPGADADAVAASFRPQIDAAEVAIVANRELRRISLEIFDRTFRITAVLRLLAVAVAFFGVFSALMALQLERGRELAVLRALGLEPGQMKRLLNAQNALLGALAGVFAMPLGILMSAMLVYVINKRSFGWTLHLHVEPAALLQGVGLAVFAALLAGWLPARRMAEVQPARALREE